MKIIEKCQQSPYCTDEKCCCEDYQTRSNARKISDFHAKQMNTINKIIYGNN